TEETAVEPADLKSNQRAIWRPPEEQQKSATTIKGSQASGRTCWRTRRYEERQRPVWGELGERLSVGTYRENSLLNSGSRRSTQGSCEFGHQAGRHIFDGQRMEAWRQEASGVPF